MNRLEVKRFLASFFAQLNSKTRLDSFYDLVLSLKRDLPLSIMLLRDLASLAAGRETVLLKRRMDRRYYRLCRISEELGRLDIKKAAGGSRANSFEDYVFSKIDFSRYRSMDEKEFETLFSEGLTDFDEAFLKKNFGHDRKEIQSLIEGSYDKTDGFYKLRKETALVLSVMRTLETSLESLSLFTDEEIMTELRALLNFVGEKPQKSLPLMYPLMVNSLDNRQFPHEDGMTTKLFISPQGDLSGTFRPQDKPWTMVLIPRSAFST